MAQNREAPSGTYVLLIELDAPATIEFGAAGLFELAPGAYAYVGSAFGTGGLARVDRHRELAAGNREARHWHVDYLLAQPSTRIERVLTTTGVDCECDVATALDGVSETLPLGASDCNCQGHLFYAEDGDALASAVASALSE